MMLTLLNMVIFSILNRARGSQIFGLSDSTTLGRLFAMEGMALVIYVEALYMNDSIVLATKIFLWMWAALYLWTVFGWDAYWGAMLGFDHKHSRLWGLYRMAIRQSVGMLSILGLAYFTGHMGRWWYGIGFPLLALPYMIYGSLKKPYAVPDAEFTDGALMGLMISLVMGV